MYLQLHLGLGNFGHLGTRLIGVWGQLLIRDCNHASENSPQTFYYMHSFPVALSYDYNVCKLAAGESYILKETWAKSIMSGADLLTVIAAPATLPHATAPPHTTYVSASPHAIVTAPPPPPHTHTPLTYLPLPHTVTYCSGLRHRYLGLARLIITSLHCTV